MVKNPGKLLSFLVIAVLFLSMAAVPVSSPAQAEEASARKLEGLLSYLSIDRATIFKILLDGAQKIPPVVAAAGKLTSARLAVLDEFLKPQMNEAVLKAHAAKIITSFDEMSRAAHDLILGVKSHLTAEQQEKMIMGLLFKGMTAARNRNQNQGGAKIINKVRKQAKSFTKRLDLSPEQRVAMKGDFLTALPGLVESGTKVLSLMIGCAAEMMKPDCKRDAAEKRRTEVVEAVKEVGENAMNLIIKVRSRLHPEQVERLRKIFPLRLLAKGI